MVRPKAFRTRTKGILTYLEKMLLNPNNWEYMGFVIFERYCYLHDYKLLMR